MNLHRIEGTAEWAAVSPRDRNAWQKAAASTHGIVTIGNFFSLLGLLSVPYGLILVSGEDHIMAIVVLALGRLCDLLDGWLADKTATKSPLGEKIDASFDKVSTGAAVAGLVLLGILPGIIAAGLIVPHAIIAVLALIAFAAKKPFHPSIIGKLSMAALWLTILVFMAIPALPSNVQSQGELIALGVFYMTTALGVAALLGYIMELYRSRRQTPVA